MLVGYGSTIVCVKIKKLFNLLNLLQSRFKKNKLYPRRKSKHLKRNLKKALLFQRKSFVILTPKTRHVWRCLQTGSDLTLKKKIPVPTRRLSHLPAVSPISS